MQSVYSELNREKSMLWSFKAALMQINSERNEEVKYEIVECTDIYIENYYPTLFLP